MLSAESFKALESAPHFSFPLEPSSNGSFSVVLRGSLKIEEKLKAHPAQRVFMTKEESDRQSSRASERESNGDIFNICVEDCSFYID